MEQNSSINLNKNNKFNFDGRPIIFAWLQNDVPIIIDSAKFLIHISRGLL